MKKLILILFFIPVLCWSQSTTNQRITKLTTDYIRLMKLISDTSLSFVVVDTNGNIRIHRIPYGIDIQPMKITVTDTSTVSEDGQFVLSHSKTMSPEIYSLYGGVNSIHHYSFLQAFGGWGMITAKPIILNPRGGNIGIGTTSPDCALHVAGMIKSDSTITPGLSAIGNVGAEITVNLATGNTFTLTRNESTTVTLSGGVTGATYTFIFTHENSTNGYSVDWHPDLKWSGGVSLTFTDSANAVDIVVLKNVGGTYYASGSADFK